MAAYNFYNNNSTPPPPLQGSPVHFTSNSYNSSRSPSPSASGSGSASPFPSPSSSSSRGSNNLSSGGKRKQVKNACVNCQKACKKCDDQRPCSRCVKYGIEDGCVNSQRKERKKKSSATTNSEDQTLKSSSTSRRLITSSVPSSPTSPQLTLRLSTRNGIRSFPKELLKSLQQEEAMDNDEEIEEDVQEEEEAEPNVKNPLETHPKVLYDPVQSICPQVTDEFKTLAKICSDLHTVMVQPPTMPQLTAGALLTTTTSTMSPYVPSYPVNFHQMPYPLQLNPFQTTGTCFIQQQQQRQPSFSSTSSRPTSPPLIQRRSISPSQLLKPTSPIFHLQNHPNEPQMFFTGQPPQLVVQTPLIQRDMMNRTPPEEEAEEAEHENGHVHDSCCQHSDN